MTQPDDGAAIPSTTPDDTGAAVRPADPTAAHPPRVPPSPTPPSPAPPSPGYGSSAYPPPGYGPSGYPPGYGPASHPMPGYGTPPRYGTPPGYGTPPALSPAGQPLAGFGERLGAYLIDGLILTVASVVIVVPIIVGFFALFAPQLEPPGPGMEPRPEDVVNVLVPVLASYLAALVITLGLYYVYYVEMMFRSGQTLGKKALQLRVVPLDPALTLTRGMAAKRYAIQILAGSFLPFLALVDGLWQLWDKPYRQCLHDKAAGTITVKVSVA